MADANDFLGADPTADPKDPDAFLGDDPKPKQTLKGFGQAAGTIPLNAAVDLTSIPEDTLYGAANLATATAGTAKGAAHELTDQQLPKGEKLSDDGRAGVTPGGLYHYRDENGQEVYSKKPPPKDSYYTHPAYSASPIDLPEPLDTAELPGSSENVKRLLRNTGASPLLDVKEKTAINNWAALLGTAATEGAVGGASGMIKRAGTGALVRGAGASADATLSTEGRSLADIVSSPESKYAPIARGAAGGAAAAGAGETAHEEGASDSVSGAVAAAAGVLGGYHSEGRRSAPRIEEPKEAPGSGAYPPSIDKLLDRNIKPETAASPAPAEPKPAAPKQSGRGGIEPTPTENARTDQLVKDLSGSAAGAAAAPGYEVKEGGEEPPALKGDPEHPMRNGKPYTMISGELTPEQSGLPEKENAEANDSRHQALGQVLQTTGMKTAPTIGAFQGSPERGYAVQAETPEQREAVENIGRTFKQTSVMHVDDDKSARFKNSKDGTEEDAGKMTQVAAEEAAKAPGYTRDADGNYYVAKPVEAQAAPKPTQDPNKTLYGPPAKVGSSEAEPTPEGQQARVDTFKRVGLPSVRNSAITGDYRGTGQEFQTSQLKDQPQGDALAKQIDMERQTLAAHARSLIDATGGTQGDGKPELKARGNDIESPILGYQDHLENSMQQVYEEGKKMFPGKTYPMTQLQTLLQKEKSRFTMADGGTNFRNGILERLDELGLLNKDGTIKPATAEQSEAVRRSVVEAYNPKLGKLHSLVKGLIDGDMENGLGGDVFKKGRAIRSAMAANLEEPDGVSKLLMPTKENRLGVNRNMPQDEVPGYVTGLDDTQFKHVVNVLEQAANAGVPALREQARKGLAQIRAQFANEYLAAVTNDKTMHNQKNGNKYLRNNELNMRHVFTPEEMQGFVDNDNAGRWLSMDRSYPGAAAQGQNFLSHATKLANKITPSPALGAGIGGITGALIHGANAAIGAGIGLGLKGATGAAENYAGKLNAQKLITQLDKWKPEKPAKPNGANIPGQRGAVGNVGKQSTAGMRSKQGGGGGKQKLPKEITGGLTEPERAQLRADTTARVLDAFHGLGKSLTPELAAAALGGKAKRGWYRNSAEAITNLFGPDAPRFAGVLAAMSPQTSVEMNLHNAIRTFVNWDKAGRPTDPKAIEGIMRNSVQKARPEDPGLLHAWVPNTIKALTHANPENLPIPVNPAAKPSAQVRKVADQYMKSTGREYTRPEPTQVDPERAKKIADAYDAMEHNPNDPKVKASYNAMIKETMDQYKAMKKSGLKVEFFPEGGKDPYEGNPRAAIDDIQNNNHLYVYPTKDGFGSTAGPTDNPLLADSGEKFGKVPATHNDIFRAVHDYFGHAADGNGFRAAGEENAWRQHAAMYSDLARPAMTTETRGQNSWVNFGPHGDVNRTAKQGETTYAEQKTGLLPKEFSDPKNVGKNELQLSGPKVNSFMKNLRDSVNEVTLDAWMSTFANIDPAKLGGSGNLSGPGKSPTYLAYSAHVRNAASMLTQMTGEKWTPAEVQETVWSFAKTAFEYATAHGISIEQAMKSGAITDDLIRSTPDFHTLFSSPEHAGFIQSSRYADNAKRLGGGQSQSTNAADSGQKSQAAKEALRPHLVSATKRLDTVLEGRRSAGRVKPKTDAIDMGGKLMSSDNGEAPF